MNILLFSVLIFDAFIHGGNFSWELTAQVLIFFLKPVWTLTHCWPLLNASVKTTKATEHFPCMSQSY